MKQRLKIHIQGAVQGVGFRPFVWRLAHELQLSGWVKNTSHGVFIEAEGQEQTLRQFLAAIPEQKPQPSRIYSLKHVFVDAAGYTEFFIDHSDNRDPRSAWMLPDIATCPECLRDIQNPQNRRYRYPFTNCTHCGPRFSIIEALPYDRHNTTMKAFRMCRLCQAEYNDPENRRFHAQPNACPECGPIVELWDEKGHPLQNRYAAIEQTARLVSDGHIVAVKGLGGFHLMVDATNDEAVRRLRLKKARDEKPFAVMLPSLKAAQQLCEMSEQEMRLLTSPEAPIVLLEKRHSPGSLSSFIAPQNPMLGVMLPYTPLHHILLELLNRPVIATSGNLTDETICTDNIDAISRLGHIADAFLVHNRPIAQHVDDSIVRVLAGRPVVLRRARGYAPLPIMASNDNEPVLAVGGHLKNSIALHNNGFVFISQHIGDLETENSITTLQHTIADFEEIYAIHPTWVMHDAHPDYVSTRYAHAMGRQSVPIQHHKAHVFSCMADNELEPPVLGVAWDGTGYGEDGTIWGGEFFLVNEQHIRRIAHIRTFPLPGGDTAIKQPFRSALGLLFEMDSTAFQTFTDLPPFQNIKPAEAATIEKMLQQNINSPRTSSIGRLFDAVASLLDLQHMNHFEGQAAMQLEFAARQAEATQHAYPCCFDFDPDDAAVWSLNWQPMLEAILSDLKTDVEKSTIAATFHNTLVQTILKVAHYSGQNKIALSGGTFQNKYLVDKAHDVLTNAGFAVYTHQQVPPNDGGISLGQIAGFKYIK